MREALCMLLLVVACTRGGSGPMPIAYDKESCAYCHMLIGDPRFAAQLVTEDSGVVNFDDPGCLLRFVAEQHPRARAIWFRDSQRDRWLSAAEVGFVRATSTPMGWGLAAVDGHTPGAITFEQASAQVAQAPTVMR